MKERKEDTDMNLKKITAADGSEDNQHGKYVRFNLLRGNGRGSGKEIYR